MRKYEIIQKLFIFVISGFSGIFGIPKILFLYPERMRKYEIIRKLFFFAIFGFSGIFTRVNGKNIKGDPQTVDHEDEYRILPVRAIHQKVQYALLALSKLEECQLDKSEILPDFNN